MVLRTMKRARVPSSVQGLAADLRVADLRAAARILRAADLRAGLQNRAAVEAALRIHPALAEALRIHLEAVVRRSLAVAAEVLREGQSPWPAAVREALQIHRAAAHRAEVRAALRIHREVLRVAAHRSSPAEELAAARRILQVVAAVLRIRLQVVEAAALRILLLLREGAAALLGVQADAAGRPSQSWSCPHRLARPLRGSPSASSPSDRSRSPYRPRGQTPAHAGR
jgi:hypothetical protein